MIIHKNKKFKSSVEKKRTMPWKKRKAQLAQEQKSLESGDR
jgi:hypothetical protein